MKVYQICGDVGHYQALYPDDPEVWASKMLVFGGTPKAADWRPPRMHCNKPLLKRPDFWYVTPGALVAGASAIEAVRTPFEMAGELLDLPYQNEILTVLN